MAKKAARDANPGEALLVGLRKAIDGETHPLHVARGDPNALFSGTAAAPAAQQALVDGYVAEVALAAAPAKKTKTVPPKQVRLTDKGRQFLLANDPLDCVLKELLPLVKALSERSASVLTVLEQVLRTRSGQPSSPSVTAPTSPLISPPSLRTVLRNAYDQCTRYADCQDGLVDLPRLYHEAKKILPSLTVAAMHQELQAMWSERILELKILNEVRLAREPDLGIRRGDYLYYFVFWKRP